MNTELERLILESVRSTGPDTGTLRIRQHLEGVLGRRVIAPAFWHLLRRLEHEGRVTARETGTGRLYTAGEGRRG